MAQQSRTYHNVTQDSFDAIRILLIKNDIPVSNTPSGSVQGPHGFTIGWSYDKATETLVVSLTGSGMLIGAAWSIVERGIHSIIGG